MRCLLASALLIAGLAETVNAQAYSCYRPSEPRIPSGYTATKREMERTNEEVNQYYLDIERYIECLTKEGQHAISEIEDVSKTFKRAIDEFNRR